MYITRAQLIEDNRILKERIFEMREQIVYLRSKAKDADILLKNPMSAMTIALERVTESVAHVLGDLKRRT